MRRGALHTRRLVARTSNHSRTQDMQYLHSIGVVTGAASGLGLATARRLRAKSETIRLDGALRRAPR